jgi:acetoacetyl-CoA synthetase
MDSRTGDEIIWTPSSDVKESSNMSSFIRFLKSTKNLDFNDYEELHDWSVREPENFWSACWDFVGAIGDKGSDPITHGNAIIDTRFFPRGVMNFAEGCLAKRGPGPAIIFTQEHTKEETISWDDLYARVAALVIALRADGVRKGDRVCAVVANVPETVICMLAVGAIGAIWSSVSPDFGVEGVMERFCQIQPKVFFHSDFYFNKNRLYNVLDRVREIEAKLAESVPESGSLISISITDHGLDRYITSRLRQDLTECTELNFESTNFNDPMFIMFSSGTTGKPKCIVHRHGVLLQLMKEHKLHCDIRPGDRVFYYTTTTWMMWNWLVGCLASHATIMLYEGNPFYPNCNSLFDFVGRYRGSFFGVSAKFIDSLKLAPEFIPNPPEFNRSVRTIASTGSPLIPESFDFIYSNIKRDVNVASICGGTDILSCFILGCPIKPVKRGFSQCRGLGMDVQIWDPDTGKPVVGQKGELVCCSPFPSQPIGFWGDDDKKSKYREAYFSEWPNVWKHGDYCMLDSDGHVFVYGRSDATLKPGGVRIGTAEIYRAVETLPFIRESICCGVELKPGEESIALFVVLTDETGILSADKEATIRSAIHKSSTRHHIPQIIHQVHDIPRTKSGKIVELAVKNILGGFPVKNLNTLANPEALDEFKQFAK